MDPVGNQFVFLDNCLHGSNNTIDWDGSILCSYCLCAHRVCYNIQLTSYFTSFNSFLLQEKTLDLHYVHCRLIKQILVILP